MDELVKGRGKDKKKRKKRTPLGRAIQHLKESGESLIETSKRAKAPFETSKKLGWVWNPSGYFGKARTKGAKDIQPRRRRGAIHNVLTSKGYEKGSVAHPKADFYHKLDTGDLVIVNKKDGRWSHYTNKEGFTKQGSSHEDLRQHISN